MAHKQLWNPQYRTYIASAVVAKGKAVTLSSADNTVEAVDDAAETVVGFVEVAASAAKRETTVFEEGGDAVGIAGGAVTKGAHLVIDANGELVVRGTTANTVYHCVGHALEAAAEDKMFRFRFTKFSVTA